jgi:hypothetical protein
MFSLQRVHIYNQMSIVLIFVYGHLPLYNLVCSSMKEWKFCDIMSVLYLLKVHNDYSWHICATTIKFFIVMQTTVYIYTVCIIEIIN